MSFSYFGFPATVAFKQQLQIGQEMLGRIEFDSSGSQQELDIRSQPGDCLLESLFLDTSAEQRISGKRVFRGISNRISDQRTRTHVKQLIAKRNLEIKIIIRIIMEEREEKKRTQ
jgi:hypothetical protein